MIEFEVRGNGNSTENWLRKILRGDIYAELDRYGQMGVQVLQKATPIDTGLTASSWRYRIIKGRNPTIEWYNTRADSSGRTSVAVLIQYGHGTNGGGYVQGRDFINPAMRPTFDKIADEVWKKVMA
jgi:hypothetical protein